MRHLLIFAWLALSGTCVSAQTYTVSTVTAPAFGNIAAATTGVTTFKLDASTSAVTILSGNGGKFGGTTARSTVTITCVDGTGGPRRCSNTANKALIKIGASGTPTGRAQAVSAFDVVSGTGTVTNESAPAGDGSITLNLSGWTASNTGLTFSLGMNLPIKGDDLGGTTGAASAGFYVRAALDPTTPTVGTTSTAGATVRRSLVVTKLSDLSFGSIVRPATGSGTVDIDEATGARTVGGTNPPLAITGPAFGRAVFTITGESGTAFSISGPASFNMTSGSSAITVTLGATAFGPQTLTGGSFTLGAGGTITITSTTPTGAYSGTFVATVTYN